MEKVRLVSGESMSSAPSSVLEMVTEDPAQTTRPVLLTSLGLAVVHGVDQDLEDEGDGGLVLVRPVQTLGPCHQHHLVLHGIASVMNVLKYFLEISTNIFVNYK